MDGDTLRIKPVDRPRLTLICYWLCWKAILLGVALTSPGLGYDTSTSVLLDRNNQSRDDSLLSAIPKKLVRWDAIYFTETARRGYLFEQEWAFGWGFTRFLHIGSQAVYYVGSQPSSPSPAYIGVAMAHLCHLLSVLVLYELSKVIRPAVASTATKRFSFIAACLHIISPAGIFLSAPYAESPFSLLNIGGMYLYALAKVETSTAQRWKKDILTVAAGVLFGIATTFRSNGLLSGLIFVYDAITSTVSIARRSEVATNLRTLCATMLAGSVMALGSLTPQYLAYSEYCSGSVEVSRPWCSRTFPSIYTWVQKQYWGVGLLGYWTISNIPLFLLAAPMLYIMMHSVIWAWGSEQSVLRRIDTKKGSIGGKANPVVENESATIAASRRNVLRRLLVPQLALAIMALTSYHVQIITRLSSGYPVWYWWLTRLVLSEEKVYMFGSNWHIARMISSWMVGYAVIQGGLFASFLPPA